MNILNSVVILVDARHLPSEDDLSMVEYARYFKIPICIVATKIDKVKPTQRSHKIKMIKQALELSENEILIPFSAISKQGIDDVWKRLIEMMEDE